MPKLTILAPAAIATLLLSAVVWASTPTSGTDAEAAKAPNRAEVFAAKLCGAPAATLVAQAGSWQDALGSKRMADKAPIMASATADCDKTEK